jgi:hypothetical protein
MYGNGGLYDRDITYGTPASMVAGAWWGEPPPKPPLLFSTHSNLLVLYSYYLHENSIRSGQTHRHTDRHHHLKLYYILVPGTTYLLLSFQTQPPCLVHPIWLGHGMHPNWLG